VRDRILATAYDLFAYRGFRAVGVDEIIGRTGIAKATFYRHFPTKNALGLAFLTRREQLWTHEYFEARSRLGGRTPEDQLLAMFDVLDEWFRQTDFEGCSFITILLEVGSSHPLGEACVEQLGNIRAIVESLARDAGLTDAHGFACQWHILLKGAIVGACEGDLEAASRVRPVAEAIIELHRPVVALAGR
jgi:AcrR family transcriptional regulator